MRAPLLWLQDNPHCIAGHGFGQPVRVCAFPRNLPSSKNFSCNPCMSVGAGSRTTSAVRRDTGALSTFPAIQTEFPAFQTEPTPSWKKEVSRRVAAHKSHKGAAPAEAQSRPETRTGSSRAAEAAARVARRFAQAPSYDEMLADEARAALRAAEAASQAALQAQAAAESVLASLEGGFDGDLGTGNPATHAASDSGYFPWSDEMDFPPARTAAPQTAESTVFSDPSFFSIRWDQDLPRQQPQPSITRAVHEAAYQLPEEPDQGMRSSATSPAEDWRQQLAEAESIQIVEAARPIHANLIEFPRELVATRKARPRLAEAPYAAPDESSCQLSIFEVYPGTISTEPQPARFAPGSAAPAPAWPEPEWSRIQLDEQPAEDLLDEPDPAVSAAPAIELASASRRLMSAVVDGSLIVAAFLGAAMTAASNSRGLPAPRVVELAAVAALLVIAVLYKTLFYTLAAATPGMKYAGIELVTFTGSRPARAQRLNRLGALLLSLLPVGLGVVWSIFDDEHLSWHDRLSQTYLRRD
jgi:uncharacterized RDD family membrane protein YckC